MHNVTFAHSPSSAAGGYEAHSEYLHQESGAAIIIKITMMLSIEDVTPTTEALLTPGEKNEFGKPPEDDADSLRDVPVELKLEVR